MSFKNVFDRCCCESETIMACAQALQQQRFHNEPEKTIMLHDSLNAAIARLKRTCEHMGFSLEDMSAQYDLLYVKRKKLRSVYLRFKRQNRRERQCMGATTHHDQQAKQVETIRGV